MEGHCGRFLELGEGFLGSAEGTMGVEERGIGFVFWGLEVVVCCGVSDLQPCVVRICSEAGVGELK